MPQKCETVSYCSPTPYRQPPASSPPSVWRFATMHLKPYPKPQDKESVHNATPGLRANQQGVLRKEWGIRQACGLMGSPGNGTANRCPLRVISTNTLRCGTNSGSNAPTRVSGARRSKAPSVATFTSSLVLLSSSNTLENESSPRILQGENSEESLDILAVIKPGNTKEKIAIFAEQKCGNSCSSDMDNVTVKEAKEAVGPELRTVSVKNKGCWEAERSGFGAKRRRRSGNPESKQKGVQSPALKPDKHRISRCEIPNENTSPYQRIAESLVSTEGEETEKAISVEEMVAYLERANSQRVNSKLPSLCSTSTIILSKFRSVPNSAEQQSKNLKEPEVQEEGESVRVLDMVAKLESQCLSRHGLRESGDLSRNNSLKRKVGRVLLAGSKPYLLPPHPVSTSVPQSVPQERGSDLDKLSSPSEALEFAKTEALQCSPVTTTTLKQEKCSLTIKTVSKLQASPKHASFCHSEEPPPGMLFFTLPLVDQCKPSLPDSTPQNKEPYPCVLDSDPSVKTSLSFREDSRDGLVVEQNCLNVEETENKATRVVSRRSVPFPFRRLVSHEFLETRFKIQLLLEPQQYLAFLPHHIIIKIFTLLPTESLAALKCTCHYFNHIIESYNVQPADSRWVSDPRYKDDPCKQCKKHYKRGDVSLCRWHHKPYCQALPYGPGYWMCCRGAHKDTPGCNVGLHDNRWVPAFHSINMPIYRKNRDEDS